jgi:protein-serine/threonine kinase
MSSAALQAPTHQPASLPGLDLHGSGQYTPSQSPSREGYYARENQSAASPASSKRPSRRPSGNAATYPDHSQAPTMSSRTALASPALATADDETPSMSTSSRRRHDPPTAPPRVSSSHQGAPTSRRAVRAEERATSSSRRSSAADTSRAAANGYDELAPRRGTSQQEAAPRDGYTTTMPIRTNTSTSSKQPSREASEVLNQIIVSQPEEDLERERERLQEAQPHHVSSSHDDYDDAVPVTMSATREVHDDSRQGRRSRHDHSKKEKTSRFGDYYLGHTIGEGEFGKVKLGWKQDDRVQVSRNSAV